MAPKCFTAAHGKSSDGMVIIAASGSGSSIWAFYMAEMVVRKSEMAPMAINSNGGAVYRPAQALSSIRIGVSASTSSAGVMRLPSYKSWAMRPRRRPPPTASVARISAYRERPSIMLPSAGSSHQHRHLDGRIGAKKRFVGIKIIMSARRTAPGALSP